MRKTTLFIPHGPYRIPVHRGPGGRTIADDRISEFWRSPKMSQIAQSIGCYVFAMKAGKGITPFYIGKTTRRSFEREAFAPRNLAKYHRCLTNYARGTPVMFFLTLPKKTGTPNRKHIGQLEKFLINVGVRVNPDLLNERGTKTEKWGILGVLRCPRGQPLKAAQEFKRLFKLESGR